MSNESISNKMFPGQWPPDPPLPSTPQTALHNAALTGDMSNALCLLGQGLSPNTSGGIYGNPLQAACLRGHEEVAFMLLYEGADVNAKGGRHGDALRAACFRGHEEIVELLIEHGAEVKGPERYGALYVACEAGHLEVVRLLLEKGVDWRRQWGRLGGVVDVARHFRDERLEGMVREKGAVLDREEEVASDEVGDNSSDQEGCFLGDGVAPLSLTPGSTFRPPAARLKSHDQRAALNVILQIYFHIKPLRTAIDGILSDESKGRIFTNALNGLFISLKKSAPGKDFSPCCIHKLEENLIAVLTDQIEDTILQHTISNLFKIRSKLYDTSLVSETSVHCNEEYWHLDLKVGRAHSLNESLQDLIQPYFSREDARVHGGMFYLGTEKGRVFECFPPVLSLHLQRNEYDAGYQTGARNNGCFEYPEEIDLSPYLSIEADRSEPWVYTLLAVVVYDGKNEAGVHYGYLRTRKDQFLRCYDKTVESATAEEVLSGNFGGDNSEVKYRSVCMLYYCWKCKLEEILVDAEEKGPFDSLEKGWDFFKR